MAALGVFLFAANPRKDWNRLFALFAIFWGAQSVASNVIRVTTSENVAWFTSELGLALVIPLPFFLVMFAAIFPRPGGWFASSPLGFGLVLAPAIVALGMLFLAPRLLLEGVVPSAEGGYTVRWGPALPHVIVAPLYGAFVYAVARISTQLEQPLAPIERRQTTYVLAAFAVFAAYSVPAQLFLFGGAALGLRPATMARTAEAIVIALVMLAAAGVLVMVATRLLRRARAQAGGAPASGREARVVLLAMGAAALVGLVIGATTAAGAPRVDILGVVRAASVAIIVYAVARWQLFDIDLRLKGLATVAGASLAGLAIAGVAWITLRRTTLGDTAGAYASVAIAAIAIVPLASVAARLADRLAPRVTREGDHVYLRKLDVYRAAFEQRILRERGAAESADPWLASLRADLGLSARDHDVVASLVLSGAESAPAVAPDLRVGRVAFGKYQVEAVLAEGGFGRVLLATDRMLERKVVIKELLAKWRDEPGIVATFLNEARVAGALQHPNIVTIHEVQQHGQDRYIVMEHVAGGSVEDALRAGPLPTADACQIGLGVLAGLRAAHERGVVHRDVKPANVLLGGRDREIVKLADFGIAQLQAVDPGRTISGLTTVRPPQPGTPLCMSPEQARGEPVDARSDLYAVGAMLHRMLVGTPHVDVRGLDEFRARERVAHPPVYVAPPAVPRALGAVLVRALEPDRARRYASAEEFARELRAAAAQAIRSPSG